MSPWIHSVAVMTVVVAMAEADRRRRSGSGRGGESRRREARLFRKNVDGDTVRGHILHCP